MFRFLLFSCTLKSNGSVILCNVILQLLFVLESSAAQMTAVLRFPSVGHEVSSEPVDVGKAFVAHLTHVLVLSLVCFSLVSLQVAAVAVAFVTQITGIRLCHATVVFHVNVTLQAGLVAAGPVADRTQVLRNLFRFPMSFARSF